MLIENVLKMYASGACKYLAGSANKKSKKILQICIQYNTGAIKSAQGRSVLCGRSESCAGAANEIYGDIGRLNTFLDWCGYQLLSKTSYTSGRATPEMKGIILKDAMNNLAIAVGQ